jgi:hypothetical protein
MWDFNDVITIEYRSGHVFRIVFDNGLEADVDLTEYLDAGPVFAPLKDPAFFQQARIEGGTIVWPNGADIAPETLYEKVQAASQALQATR